MAYEQTNKINLSCKKLVHFTQSTFDALLRECKQSKSLGRKSTLYDINLKKNQLSNGLECLSKIHLIRLNIGENWFETLYDFEAAVNLVQLHAFSNRIKIIETALLLRMQNLNVLNLNSNQLEVLPNELGKLVNLERLSLNTTTDFELYPSALYASRSYAPSKPLTTS